MPHFLASHIVIPPLPYTVGDYHFIYEAKKCGDEKQSLILVHFENQEFYLRKVCRTDSQHNEILKCEKNTKIKPTGIIKNALKILCDTQENVISHNLNNNSIRQNLQSDYLKSITFFTNFTKSFILEIGFGSGRHLLHLAKENPHTICVGIEIHTPSIEQILRQIQIKKLENLYIINCDARILLEIMPDNLAQAIYIHFPVPWHKKPHRRVFSEAFLSQALRVLQPNGMLHLRSDDEQYFTDSLQIALRLDSVKIHLYKNQQTSVVSKYEARWKKQYKNIYDLQIFKNTSLIDNTPTKNMQKMQKNFHFDKILRKNLDNYINYPSKILEKDWFLHIDSLYTTHNVYVLMLCFGDFNQPQNKFLHIEFREDKAKSWYIGGDPIPTNAAIKAHQYLKKILMKE